jgi:tRNA(fMet)-specific endonuclease VapC
VTLFLLDTNAIVSLLKTRASPLSERVHAHESSELAASAISVFELYFGAFKSARRDENLLKLDALGVEVIPFSSEDARHAGDIRATLRARGTPIGPYDLLIAGQARARGLTLVTNNVREFRRVPDLRVEDWTTV